jgi:hypothetical protein
MLEVASRAKAFLRKRRPGPVIIAMKIDWPEPKASHTHLPTGGGAESGLSEDGGAVIADDTKCTERPNLA